MRTLILTVTCPRVTPGKKGTVTTRTMTSCTKCKYHEDIRDLHVLCNFPTRYGRTSKFEEGW